jgi:hypothetical protein
MHAFAIDRSLAHFCVCVMVVGGGHVRQVLFKGQGASLV